MSQLKKLVGQTAIYGLSSIIARLLNFLLVPWYTDIFETSEYGVVSELYSFVAILIVMLTFGMETSFFRFSANSNEKENIFNSSLTMVGVLSIFFLSICLLFSQEIGNILGYPSSTEYVVWFALIIGFDSIASIPLAKLRELNKAKTFVTVNIVNILVNIGLNLFFFIYC